MPRSHYKDCLLKEQIFYPLLEKIIRLLQELISLHKDKGLDVSDLELKLKEEESRIQESKEHLWWFENKYHRTLEKTQRLRLLALQTHLIANAKADIRILETKIGILRQQ